MTTMIRRAFEAAVAKVGGAYRVTLSTGSEDRTGERIRPEGWKFPATLPLLWSHQPNDLPIGRVRNIRVTGCALLGSLEFPPPNTYAFADQVRALVDAGFLGTVSVGFRPLVGPRGEWTYYEQELLELSVVNIPALPAATIGGRADFEPMRKWLAADAEIVLSLLPDVEGKGTLPESQDDVWPSAVVRARELLENYLAVLGDEAGDRRYDGLRDVIERLTRWLEARTSGKAARGSGLAYVDPVEVSALVRDVFARELAGMVRTETRAAINRLRGRLD